MWIKTEQISVPAHANQTTEVNINEWFIQNRSFLLGTPVANQLRGTAGGWVQSVAIAPHPGQDTIALLRDRLSQLLKITKGDVASSPKVGTNASTSENTNTMATVIPVDRFEFNSFYSFILRENPKAQGIEIHFPPDCTNGEVMERWTNRERNNLRDRINAGTNGFVSLIEKEGFEQAHKNPFLWYVKETEPASFNQKISKARSWVNKCSSRGAYEIDTSIPVEHTKSRRRSASKAPVQTSCDPHTPPTQPTQGNRLADAIAAVLLPQIVEAVSSGVSAEELERVKQTASYQAAQIEQLKTERDAALAKIQEMEKAMATLSEEVEKFRDMAMELERDRDTLKRTLTELGVDEIFTPPAQDVDWGNTDAAQPEPEAMSWDDDEPSPESHASYTTTTQEVSWDEDESLGESQSDSESDSDPDDTEESEESDDEGLDLDSLDSLGEF